MMRRIIALALVGVSIPAGAEPTKQNKIGNGADALVTCSSREVKDYVFCQGFIRGYVSAMALAKFSNENPEAQNPVICLDPKSTSENWHQMYIDWLRASPGDLDVEAGTLLFGMLATKFPCGKGS